MVLEAQVGEQARVHRGVQRAHATVEVLGVAGDVGDLRDGEARVGDRRAVPPVETISTPAPTSAVASSTRPRLSLTAMSARRTGTRSRSR